MSRFIRSRMMTVAAALEFDENKKRIFKGLGENDFADLALTIRHQNSEDC